MRHYILLLSICAATLTACELQREYNGDLFPTEEARLVCFAILGNETPPAVYLFPTQNVLDTASAQFLPNALVELYRNGILVEAMQFEGDKYIASPGFSPQAGDAYQLEIRHTDYPELTSEVVIHPPLPELESIEWVYNADSSRIIVTLVVAVAPIQSAEDYAISAELYSAVTPTQLSSGSARVSDATLLPNNRAQYQINTPVSVTIFEQFIPVDTVTVDRIKVNVRSFSDAYPRYFSTLPDGEFGGFFPPQDTLYSNFNGGYGIFFIQSTTSSWIII